jgi:prepilin signal peptidase PulO-like enzyme (type II secretory pathway)
MTPLVAALFGCAAFLTIQLSASICAKIVPFDDGPKPGKPPTPWLIAGAVAAGAIMTVRGADLPQLGLAALLIVSLVGSWYSDVRVGIVPDYFTLVPLGALLLLAVVGHEWTTFIAMIAVSVPFAIAAAFSKGRGMGWGDVKLVALGGAALGLQAAVIALAGACLIAVVIPILRKRRNEPIALAPYLASAIGVALTLNFF